MQLGVDLNTSESVNNNHFKLLNINPIFQTLYSSCVSHSLKLAIVYSKEYSNW